MSQPIARDSTKDLEREKVARHDAASEKKMARLYIYVLAFFSGMCIMAVELCASRLMAPFFGTSTFVWTNIIGIIMIGGVAMAVSGFTGTYMTESAERSRSLNELEDAMLVDLKNTVHGEA